MLAGRLRSWASISSISRVSRLFTSNSRSSCWNLPCDWRIRSIQPLASLEASSRSSWMTSCLRDLVHTSSSTCKSRPQALANKLRPAPLPGLGQKALKTRQSGKWWKSEESGKPKSSGWRRKRARNRPNLPPKPRPSKLTKKLSKPPKSQLLPPRSPRERSPKTTLEATPKKTKMRMRMLTQKMSMMMNLTTELADSLCQRGI